MGVTWNLLIAVADNNIGMVSPYRSGALSHLQKKNMAGKLFFVFAKIRVPLVCTYVYCTKWSCNISLIHVKVR